MTLKRLGPQSPELLRQEGEGNEEEKDTREEEEEEWPLPQGPKHHHWLNSKVPDCEMVK